jgi:hypothetical protein
MYDEKRELKERFDALFAEWEKVILDPKVRLSSRPQDYLNNKPYREIVKLGEDVLPFIMAKLEQGIFLLNQAVVDIAGIKMEQIIGKEQQLLSEQKKSDLILKWWRSRKQ